MPSNDRERWRYVAFKIEGEAPFARDDFLGSLLSEARGTAMANSFRITVFEGDFGILKVPHKLKEDAIRMLSSVVSVRGRRCRVLTLKTSGTIRTLKRKYKDRLRDSRDTTE